MLKRIGAAYLVTTALTIVPALAQSNGSHDANTQAFVTKAAEGGMFEIQSSQLALKKSQDKDVRDFAQRMIDDHGKADDRLKSLAKNERVPSSLDPEHQQMLSRLAGENGSSFVDQYKQMQVSAHHQAIDAFQAYAKTGQDPALRDFAQQTLPTLNEHLQMAQQITIASNDASPRTAPGGGERSFITQQNDGTWRTSKLIGLGVYNEQNERVGDINEVLLDRDGRAQAVVIGVGGFLGLGERNVAVRFDELKWSTSPPSTARADAAADNPTGATAPTAGLGNPASPVSPVPTGTGAQAGGTLPAAYPDHAVLPNASKDQLQHAPQFQYGAAPR